MAFSAEELAEMARADAEIEASFQLTQDEIILGRKLDSAAALDNMDAERRKVAERRRQYREANKAKLAERQRQYREANKAKLAERQRQYREANKAKLAERQRQYREANKAKLVDYQRQYREANKGCTSDGKCAIKLCRLGLGLSQKEFARLVGVTQGTVSCWENVKAPEEWANIIEMVRKLHPETQQATAQKEAGAWGVA